MKDLKDQSTGMKIEAKEVDANNLKSFPFDASYQGVKRLFVLDFNNTDGNANQVEKTVIENIFSQE